MSTQRLAVEVKLLTNEVFESWKGLGSGDGGKHQCTERNNWFRKHGGCEFED